MNKFNNIDFNVIKGGSHFEDNGKPPILNAFFDDYSIDKLPGHDYDLPALSKILELCRINLAIPEDAFLRQKTGKPLIMFSSYLSSIFLEKFDFEYGVWKFIVEGRILYLSMEGTIITDENINMYEPEEDLYESVLQFLSTNNQNIYVEFFRLFGSPDSYLDFDLTDISLHLVVLRYEGKLTFYYVNEKVLFRKLTIGGLGIIDADMLHYSLLIMNSQGNMQYSATNLFFPSPGLNLMGTDLTSIYDQPEDQRNQVKIPIYSFRSTYNYQWTKELALDVSQLVEKQLTKIYAPKLPKVNDFENIETYEVALEVYRLDNPIEVNVFGQLKLRLVYILKEGEREINRVYTYPTFFRSRGENKTLDESYIPKFWEHVELVEGENKTSFYYDLFDMDKWTTDKPRYPILPLLDDIGIPLNHKFVVIENVRGTLYYINLYSKMVYRMPQQAEDMIEPREQIPVPGENIIVVKKYSRTVQGIKYLITSNEELLGHFRRR